jgi:hypothetical protein
VAWPTVPALDSFKMTSILTASAISEQYQGRKPGSSIATHSRSRPELRGALQARIGPASAFRAGYSGRTLAPGFMQSTPPGQGGLGASVSAGPDTLCTGRNYIEIGSAEHDSEKDSEARPRPSLNDAEAI